MLPITPGCIGMRETTQTTTHPPTVEPVRPDCVARTAEHADQLAVRSEHNHHLVHVELVPHKLVVVSTAFCNHKLTQDKTLSYTVPTFFTANRKMSTF